MATYFHWGGRARFAAILGSGIMFGAGAVILYYRLNRRVQLSVYSQFRHELAALTMSISSLVKEIEELKKIRGSADVKVASRPSSTTISSTEYFTAPEDDEDEEFYDFSDAEDFEEDAKKGRVSFQLTPDVAPETTDVLALFDEVDELLSGGDNEQIQAYNQLLDNEDELYSNFEFLWRISKAARMVAIVEENNGNLNKKKELIFRAFDYADKALRLTENNAEVHKWYAVTLGAKGDYLGVRDKIQNGFAFKQHIDRALQLNPSDPILHHLLGRFCYEVSLLSWIEKKVAATLFATPPSATIEEAVDHFLQAEQMKKGSWKENQLFLAKSYIELGQYDNAMKWIDRAMDIPIHSADDQVSHNELLELEKKYSSYRL